MRWRTAFGDKTRLSVEEFGRKCLLELARAARSSARVRWHKAVGATASLSVKESCRKCLMEPTSAAKVWEDVGARPAKLTHF